MKVSVVIPTLNGGELFKEVLDRILAQKVAGSVEILCIDSGSEDGTAEYARACGTRLINIKKSEFNHGLTRNRAIQEGSGELVALTVQDALPLDEYWLEKLLEALASDDQAAAAYSRQIPRQDCHPIIRDRLMNWSACRTERTIQALPTDRGWEALEPMERLGLISIDNVSSCIRRCRWEEHPFPRRNFGEDIAWACEMIRRGYRIIYEPASQVRHSHNNSMWYEFKRIYADHQNLNRMVGLTTVPRFRILFQNARGAFRHYRKIILESSMPGWEKGFQVLRAFPYAYLENLAQYLGARFRSEVESDKAPYIFVDEWLKKGV